MPENARKPKHTPAAEPPTALFGETYLRAPSEHGPVLARMKRSNNGNEYAGALCNFDATLERVTNVNDGSGEVATNYQIRSRCYGETRTFSVPAHDFANVRRWLHKVGARAVVFTGNGKAQEVCNAITMLSEPEIATEYANTGWVEIGGENVYLHAGGSIGGNGSHVTQLPEALREYVLPEPPTGDDAISAVRESLELLDVNRDDFTVPLLGYTYRCAIGPVAHAVFVKGTTGKGKTSQALCFLAHFGANVKESVGWANSDGYLEILAHCAKDTILLVDDFIQTPGQENRLEQKYDRVIRSLGNGAGRGTLTRNRDMRDGKAPRGGIVSTGEHVPKGTSIMARTLAIEPDQFDPDVLTHYQKRARSGVYAAAMAAYLHWLAPRLGDVRRFAKEAEDSYRSKVETEHRKTATALGEIMSGLVMFMTFAEEIGAVDKGEVARYQERFHNAMLAAGRNHDAVQVSRDPAEVVASLLSEMLVSGAAHVCDRTHADKPPNEPTQWGWVRVGMDWRGQGPMIGWVDTDDGELHLLPSQAWAVLKAQATRSDAPLSLPMAEVYKRMGEAGALSYFDDGKYRHQLRFGNTPRWVLSVRLGAVTDVTEVSPGGGYAETADIKALGRV